MVYFDAMHQNQDNRYAREVNGLLLVHHQNSYPRDYRCSFLLTHETTLHARRIRALGSGSRSRQLDKPHHQ